MFTIIMKTVFILICLVGIVLSIQDEYGVGQRKFKVSDKLFLERESDLLHLFQNINEEDLDEEHQKISKTYSIEENVDAYLNSSAVKQFISLYKQGLLPRGEIFSVFYDVHLQQAISLFKLFYYARDWDTLYKTAVWARNSINQGLFLYSFSTAIKHREDTFSYILPPIFEIYPYYFFKSMDLEKAQRYTPQKGANLGNVYIINSNYSNYFPIMNKEQTILSYYLEDVGISTFYYYCNVYYPFWMDGEEFKLKNDRRGEQFYYLYQQLLARYYLERLSNNLGEVESFSYDEPFTCGFYSSLKYPNGLAFPQRPNHIEFTEKTSSKYVQSSTYKSIYGCAYTKVQDFERRIRDSIDAGYVFNNNGKLTDLLGSDQTDILGNVFESNSESPNQRYYGSWQKFARHLLGYSYYSSDKYKVVPSALEHFETAIRDPAFYVLYKRMVLYFQKYKEYLPAYTYNELYFPGVKIEKVDFDRLFTYFDYFDSDVSNVASRLSGEARDSFTIKIRQQRLNHKPFTYRLTVNADKASEAIVRVYLGPKYDENDRLIDIQENRMNFVEVDIFKYNLQAGKNVIDRNSRQPYWYVPDRTTYKDLYKKVVAAIGNTEQFQMDSSEAFYGFPNRLLLPKGKCEGQTFQVYVIINPYQPPTRKEIQQDYYFHRVGTGMNYIDNYAFGFPFDRSIASSAFTVPNAQFQDVVITHKNVEDLNSSQAQNEL